MVDEVIYENVEIVIEWTIFTGIEIQRTYKYDYEMVVIMMGGRY